MTQIETLFALTAAVTAIVLLAKRWNKPYPILLVLGGLLVGFIPGLPQTELRSEVVFLVFLPPLLFVDSLNLSWRDFRRNLRPILLLAIGLVVFTSVTVAGVAHALLPGLPWAAAFMLGAVVAPTDAVATSAIAERLHLPRRIVTILQGESLVNDATAIVVYRIALGVALGGSFSLGQAAGSFALVSLGGIAVGLAAGWVIARIRRLLPQDPPLENTVSLLCPLAAYLPGEWLHVSGVLSVMACGIYLGRQGPRIISSQTRLMGMAMWQMVAFLLNGLLFLLVGLQLRGIVAALPANHPFGLLILTASLISLVVIVTRIAWVFPATYLPRLLFPVLRRNDPSPSWRPVALIGWSGMRGGISLAVALSIPQTMERNGVQTPFPFRNDILFITFVVILVTLVAQGLSLPPLIRALGITGGNEEREEEIKARGDAIRAAVSHLDGLNESDAPADIQKELRRLYGKREERLGVWFPGSETLTHGDPQEERDWSEAYLRLKQNLLDAERAAIVRMRDQSEISDETLRRIQRDLDLDQARLDSLNPEREN